MGLFSKRGSYSGRLAYDPDSGFHLAENGQRVVTDDFGRTWRYATPNDPSHFARYHKQHVAVYATTESEPHHFQPREDDPHFNPGAPNQTELKHDHDRVGPLLRPERVRLGAPRLLGRGAKTRFAPTGQIERGDPAVTSHTDAWGDA